MPSIRNAWAVCAAAALAAAPLAACGSSDSGSASGSGKDTTIRVEVGPSYWETPMRIAIAKGWFKEAGFDVKAVEYGPESSIPLVLNGQADVGVTGLGTVITHAAKGVPIKAVAGQLVEGEQRDQQLASVVARKGSGIRGVSDLAGRKVASNELKGPSAAQVVRRTNEAGGKGDAITWVAVPFPGMVEAMKRGDVDAAVSVAPFTDQLLAAGGAYISKVSRAGTPVPVYFAKKDFRQKQAAKADAFMKVLDRAYAWANENRDEALAEFAKTANIPLKAAQAQPKMKWQAAFDEKAVTGNIDDMRAAGYLKGSIGYAELVAAPPNAG
ncbi:ABC transporter substrate-binding protein [Actinomadura chibensis]|uniref:ABC transporter substrate-binding protein n=1 Tax=Actinomadura chibensis TaxID=392828 RepID=A0A5D0NE47_9ACTN|nr:ABC transporter substrate-binding protein [Actinomadura chibensis]TYB42485.1 ABC transporter substrate-binding protein [Actinomadura chibensis]